MSEMQRAYSVLNVKAQTDGDDYLEIEGIASTPAPDRMDDVVEPKGAKFATPMPLLWQHRHSEPVGQVTFAKPTKDGIPFKARLPKIKEAGKLKERVDEAIHSLQYGLVAAVSIGFRALKDGVEAIEGGGYRFKAWEWLELSLVTIPAQSEAVITAIKSIDQSHRPASGQAEDDPPGDSGTPVPRKAVVSLRKRAPARVPQVLKINPRKGK